MIKILAVLAGCLFWWSGLAQAIPITGLTGLDRADEVAVEHGQQGRDNARLHHTDFSAQNGSSTTQLVGLTSSTIHGATLASPTAVPGGDPPPAVPEPTALLLLGSGLVGLWFWRFRYC